jgi:hypothetical protein
LIDRINEGIIKFIMNSIRHQVFDAVNHMINSDLKVELPVISVEDYAKNPNLFGGTIVEWIRSGEIINSLVERSDMMRDS